MPTPVAGPPAPDDLPETYGAPAGFWIDLPGLRDAYREAGFVESLTGGTGAHARAAVMAHPEAPAVPVALVPLSTTGTDWSRRAHEALAVLEDYTGRTYLHLGAVTAREAQLWRVIAEVRSLLAAHSCDTTHTVAADGAISHRDLFEHGRCEMRTRVSARLEHLLASDELSCPPDDGEQSPDPQRPR